MQTLVPSFLEHSLASFAREQDKLRNQWEGAFGATAVHAMEEQARRNFEVFQRSMRMFLPFGGEVPPVRRSEDRAQGGRSGDLEELRSQVAAMQARIDQLVTERDAAAGGEGAAAPARTDRRAAEPMPGRRSPGRKAKSR